MDKLRDRVMLCLVFSVLFGTISFSQNNYRSNIILLIDDLVVTQKLNLDFFKKDELLYTHVYMLGDPLIIPKYLFEENDVVLKFNYWQGIENYEYTFNFSVGWIENTSYTIIKIFNLDKHKYQEVFCNQKGKYVIEIKNSV